MLKKEFKERVRNNFFISEVGTDLGGDRFENLSPKRIFKKKGLFQIVLEKAFDILDQ